MCVDTVLLLFQCECEKENYVRGDECKLLYYFTPSTVTDHWKTANKAKLCT